MPDQALVNYATQQAQQYGVPVQLFLDQITQESSWNPFAQNGAATGIAQFMPGTAQQYGVDPTDPFSSIAGAARYDAALYGQYGSWAKVLQHYGTVPTSGTLTPSQQSLLAQAQGLDSGNPAAANASGMQPGFQQAGFPLGNMLGNAASSIGSFFWDLFMRIVVILLGLLLIWQGLAMIRGTSVKEDVTVVVNNAKKKGEKTAATVEKAA